MGSPQLDRLLLELKSLDKNVVLDSVLPEVFRNLPSSSLVEVEDLLHHSMKRDFLSNLPLEITAKVLSFLDTGSLGVCCCVCSTWRDLIDDSEFPLWHRACNRLDIAVKEDDKKSEWLRLYQRTKKWSDGLNSKVFREKQLPFSRPWLEGGQCICSGPFYLIPNVPIITVVRTNRARTNIFLSILEASGSQRMFDFPVITAYSEQAEYRVLAVVQGRSSSEFVLKLSLFLETRTGVMARLDSLWSGAEMEEHWDMGVGRLMYELTPASAWFSAHAGRILAAKFLRLSGGRELLVSVAADSTVKLWKALDGVLCHTLHFHRPQIASIFLSAELQFLKIDSPSRLYLALLISGSKESSVFFLWDLSEWDEDPDWEGGFETPEVMSSSAGCFDHIESEEFAIHPGLRTCNYKKGTSRGAKEVPILHSFCFLSSHKFAQTQQGSYSWLNYQIISIVLDPRSLTWSMETTPLTYSATEEPSYYSGLRLDHEIMGSACGLRGVGSQYLAIQTRTIPVHVATDQMFFHDFFVRVFRRRATSWEFFASIGPARCNSLQNPAFLSQNWLDGLSPTVDDIPVALFASACDETSLICLNWT